MFEHALNRRTVLGSAAAIAALTFVPVGAALGQMPPVIDRFSYRAPQGDLDDLRDRLNRTRLPERETVTDWSQGVPLEKLLSLLEYWRTGYDWRRCEATLNRLDQYRTEIDGLQIHFLHIRSPHENAMPIIITHGWPGSVLEFLKLAERLTRPTDFGGKVDDAFHVILPSLPGFGFSAKPRERGWNAPRTARAWAELMRRLDYHRYVAQGGDWGAFVTTAMAQQHAAGLLAIHLNMPQVVPSPMPTTLSPVEQRAVEALKHFQEEETGFFNEQSTRPQTIGYALADSRAGLAAWMYEIFQAHTDNRGDPEDALTRDEMLDDITLYWLTNSGASSARLYFEQRALGMKGNLGIVDLPVGCSIFPHEIVQPPRV
ncbi:epoxide hydrolase family protein [Phyllobacterium sp. 628]|uniref:epoxide hydrolase family protein n=1 Tax=Phyllobacterium sp. 628 TaxID=2718938 RepID=UPI00353029B3